MEVIVSALDIGIRLVFVSLVLGLAAAAVHEGLAVAFHLRARHLRKGLRSLLNSSEPGAFDLAGTIVRHPLLWSPEPGGPSYISGSAFRIALLDTLAPRQTSEGEPASSSPRAFDIQRMRNSHIDTIVSWLWRESDNDVDRFAEKLERWFYDHMESVSGSYRFATQKRLFVIAVALTLLTNLNTFRVLSFLFLEPSPAIATSTSVSTEPRTTIALPSGARSLIGWDVDGENSLVSSLPIGTPPCSGAPCCSSPIRGSAGC